MPSFRVGLTRPEQSETTGRDNVDATQLYTDLTHQITLLEKQLGGDQANVFGTFSTVWSTWVSQPGSDIATVQTALRQSVPWLVSATQETGGEMKQAGIKVAQAVEEFRRLVIRTKGLRLNATIKGPLTQLLHDVAACFNSAFEQVGTDLPPSIPRSDRGLQSGDEELRSAVLDTLLVLSKSRLTADDPATYTHAYESLEWARRTATASPVPPPDLKQEYLRCISGAYHTIGATLCQAERFGGAARFLQQASELGVAAVSGTRLQNGGRDKQRTTLLQNLYRRWEMLGVCYVRIGDRKVRYLYYCC